MTRRGDAEAVRWRAWWPESKRAERPGHHRRVSCCSCLSSVHMQQQPLRSVQTLLQVQTRLRSRSKVDSWTRILAAHWRPAVHTPYPLEDDAGGFKQYTATRPLGHSACTLSQHPQRRPSAINRPLTATGQAAATVRTMPNWCPACIAAKMIWMRTSRRSMRCRRQTSHIIDCMRLTSHRQRSPR